eukprot:TRINITY_DN30213_c0_g1_i2.p1 TRINITY_DN30213_c0_g1~~TRINITY_DN30213_c0_g1_i2.p1  ORF type:complete len:937 (-),score=134.79 TRINITY_DN30213_c0_g1_i2:149-2959(-)
MRAEGVAEGQEAASADELTDKAKIKMERMEDVCPVTGKRTSQKMFSQATGAFYRGMVIFSALSFISDRISDLIFTHSAWRTNNSSWMFAGLVFVLLPGFVLGFGHAQRGELTMAMHSLFGITYIKCLTESWHIKAFTHRLKIEVLVYATFSSLPQFYFQSSVVLSSNFVSTICESAFDQVCLGTCPSVPEEFANITRFSCLERMASSPNTTSTSECLEWYDACVGNCTAWKQLLKTSSVRKRLTVAISDRNLPQVLESGKDWTAAKGEMQESLRRRSFIWRDRGCQVEAARDMPFFHWQQLSNQTDPGKIEFLQSMRTLKVTRLTEERYPDGTALALTTKTWIGKCLGFYTHFLIDAVAVAFVTAWIWSTLPSMERLAVAGGVLLFSQLVFANSEARMWRTSQRIGAATVVFFLSPWARLPGFPDKSAAFARVLILLRFVVAEALCVVSFVEASNGRLRSQSTNTVQLAITQVLLVLALASTKLPGPSEVWSDMYDLVTQAKLEAIGDMRVSSKHDDYLAMLEDETPVAPREEARLYFVDNQELRADTEGVTYRHSKRLTDTAGMVAPWGTCVEGHDQLDGWLKVVSVLDAETELFLPMRLQGHCVLTLQPKPRSLEEDQPLKVTIRRAAGLEALTSGTKLSDDDGYVLHCRCAISERPQISFRTSPGEGYHFLWNHSEEMPDYRIGWSLLFSVFEGTHFTSDRCLGTAELGHREVEAGFDGELPLDTMGSLVVHVTPPRAPPASAEGAFFVDNRSLRAPTRGLAYVRHGVVAPVKAKFDDSGDFAPWGSYVYGRQQRGGWLKTGHKTYLPMWCQGHQVVMPVAPPQRFLVDNRTLRALTEGLAFRRSRNMCHRDGDALAPWGTKISGRLCEDGAWLRIGARYLPVFFYGVRVLTLLPSATASFHDTTSKEAGYRAAATTGPPQQQKPSLQAGLTV